MWNELVDAGLEPKDAKFYLAVLTMDAPTVAQAAEAAEVSRTNAYDIAKRLAHKGMLSLIESGPAVPGGGGGRGRTVLRAADPQYLLDDWNQRRQVLERLVPQLRAMHAKGGAAPRSRYLEGAVGIRTALFETLDWPSPLRGVLSMRDLMTVPGAAAMRDYIAGRRERRLWLHVVRSPGKDYPHGWPSSDEDFRRTRYAPDGYIFTMTMIIGRDAVAMLSSKQENFALIIESSEYAEMQGNLFDVLWSASNTDPIAPA
ncbi:helix-turn-helix domain-containing protein [Saccharopolyspora phatthalungensis]|uniref:Putative transcriptional regulator n=1 Tax=Saccharopolyspora phatthalungensis TaxID=664693 RepID=A0A840QFH7_9PSEU|nr:helix-turn-helix domain-containing protein [Saccharopolyspora phatthalungensis]MBB5157235.1 putative transcriptional regulator [Saccharopolyspora phatthalungensis]